MFYYYNLLLRQRTGAMLGREPAKTQGSENEKNVQMSRGQTFNHLKQSMFIRGESILILAEQSWAKAILLERS